MLEYAHIHFDLETYTNNCSRNVKRVYTKLDKYLENPSEESIHDIRTSLRRFEAAYQSNPKQIRRKKNVKTFAETGKKLFKINSNIRDIDIIIEKLTKEGNMPEQDIEYFENSLKQEKEHHLKEALTIALYLKNIVVPNIYDKNNLRKKFSKKSQIRLTKLVNKLKTDIETNLPVVLSDDRKIVELHEVRKDAKKLRYLLELLLKRDEQDPKNRIDSDNNNGHNILSHLERIQKLLGDIHDYDITIDYLNQHQTHGASVTKVLSNIKNVRKIKFNEFVDYIKPAVIVGKQQSGSTLDTKGF